MDGFASAVLVSAVRLSLAEQGIAPAEPATPQALVPLTVKRRLLADVAGTHGLLPLLRVGLALHRLPPHPVLAALRAADGPCDLLTRWGRLERFTHSRHRVVVQRLGSTGLVAEHRGHPHEPPRPEEDALVLGVVTALLHTTGARGLTVTLASGPSVFSDGVFTAPPPDHDTARWSFTWSSYGPPAPPRPGGTGGDPAARARTEFAGNLAHRWTVDDLATRMRVSPRTLQRQLRPAGGFAALLGAVRADRAAELLSTSAHPLGVIGFVCGYADQAHFTRDFRRRTAMTPAAYRSAFPRTDRRSPDDSPDRQERP